MPPRRVEGPHEHPVSSPEGRFRVNVQVLGCSHHNAPLSLRERLAFDAPAVGSALGSFRREFPQAEAVLLSTCNRVELYLAAPNGGAPSVRQAAEFLARFHRLDPAEILEYLYERDNAEAVRHLFMVASSLDSMVVGESQILGQVRQAYQLAVQHRAAGPLTHAAFQAAVRVARRVGTGDDLHQRRVSIPSVAVADFAQQIFDRFDDKQTLVIGAGEMAAETLKYLQAQGARRIIGGQSQRAASGGVGPAMGRLRPGRGRSCWRPLPRPTW